MSRTKVMVAMSGGVDSSVAAHLLLLQGFEVVGATLRLWPADGNNDGSSAVDDARRAAERLGISHSVIDCSGVFQEQVVEYFCREYLDGRTPNPCVVCNRQVKFRALLQQARAMGMDYLATGHYVRISWDKERGRYLLYKGIDPRKDQSYVLYKLTQDQLAHLWFPLGEMTKERVRAIARELELPAAEKPESQEICFIPDNDYGSFVAARHAGQLRPGPIVDIQGRILGQHRGIAHYTVGQRRGLGVAAGKPLYVVSLDPVKNTVVVGDESMVFASSCTAGEVNFIAIDNLGGEMAVQAKIRYAAPPAEALITPGQDHTVEVRFLRPVRAITPGQAVVFYQGEMVIGGGTILRSGTKESR